MEEDLNIYKTTIRTPAEQYGYLDTQICYNIAETNQELIAAKIATVKNIHALANQMGNLDRSEIPFDNSTP